MLTKRIIPCLDVKDGVVVKGVQFKNHVVLGEILELAQRYQEQGADELVFYDITASCDDRSVSRQWVKDVAKELSIPFCVAGGIRDLATAKEVLYSGADKISVNTPAQENPALIDELAKIFGNQCVVIGVDSQWSGSDWQVYKYTGRPDQTQKGRLTVDWIKEIQDRGAGEIVLNCMSQDGMKAGYDIAQLKAVRAKVSVPLVASGGAGALEHFKAVFEEAKVDAALAAGVFHRGELTVPQVKNYLSKCGINVRN